MENTNENSAHSFTEGAEHLQPDELACVPDYVCKSPKSEPTISIGKPETELPERVGQGLSPCEKQAVTAYKNKLKEEIKEKISHYEEILELPNQKVEVIKYMEAKIEACLQFIQLIDSI